MNRWSTPGLLLAAVTIAVACTRTPTPVDASPSTSTSAATTTTTTAPGDHRCLTEVPAVCGRWVPHDGTLTIDNDSDADVSVVVTVSGMRNAVPRGASTVDVVVPAHGHRLALQLDALDATRPMAIETWALRMTPPPNTPTTSSPNAIEAPSTNSPTTPTPASVAALPCNAFAERSVCAVSVPVDGGASVWIRNSQVAVVTVTFTPLEPIADAVTVVVPPRQTVLATALPILSWRANLAWHLGAPAPSTDDADDGGDDNRDVVDLPWDRDVERVVHQADNGTFSHHGMHAWDFGMQEGSRVLAARSGVVAFAADSSTIGGGQPTFAEDGNIMLIVHDDGSVGLYGHLRFAGAWRRVGEHVDAGDLLALSGNTGFSTGPHLHFQVQRPDGAGGLTTLPLRFRTSTGLTRLEAGHSYRR